MMSKFLLQSEDGMLSEDVTTVRECIHEYNWLNPNDKHEIRYASKADIAYTDYSDFIPVGSIEFVEECLRNYNGISQIKPVLIPDELSAFAGRNYCLFENSSSLSDTLALWRQPRVFIKSASRCKCDYAGFYNIKEISHIPEDLYFVSEPLSIVSEWRAFVFVGEVQDVRCYDGDFWKTPDKETVERMIKSYRDCSPAYTLDVAVVKTEAGFRTVVMEVHNFISCGLYGFRSKRILPMLSGAYKYEIRQNQKFQS